MNEVEYILRIVLKARDELATALRKAREELRLFANAAESNQKKIDAFNKSIETMDKNVTNITDKFREWRAIIEGTGKGNEDARKSFGALGREVETTTRKQVASARSQKELLESARRLNQEIKDLARSEREGNVTRDYAIAQYKDISRQLENVSRRMNTGTQASQRAFDWSRKAAQASQQLAAAKEKESRQYVEAEERKVRAVERANDLIAREITEQIARQEEAEKRRVSAVQRGNAAVAREIEQQIRAEERASNERIKILEKEAARKQQIRERDASARDAFTRAREARSRLTGGDELGFVDIAEARQAVTVLRSVARQYNDTTKTARNLRGEAESLSHALRNVGRDTDKTGSLFDALTGAFRRNQQSIAALDNQLRGVGLLLVVGFAQQLISVLGGLAGAFVAVGASAAQAGAAIGGIFVAGVAQALPMLGLLGAALIRVKSVMDAVNQAQLAQQQSAVQAATAGRRVADATDTLREAQERLNQARKDAARDLQDLMLAEKQAELAARGAVLSQAEAQDALRQAIASGDVDAIGRAQLGVLEAQVDVEDKLLKAKRARVDADKAQRGGVEGMPGVVQANQQLETARRNASEAAAGTETAVAKLNFLLAQLSPAEKRLYDAITNIQKLFREGVYRDITDTLVESFARSVEKISDIIQMPKVIQFAQRSARTLAATMNNIFDAFTTKPMIDQFLRIGEAGRKNLAPLSDIIINIGKALVNIAEEAGPSFRNFLRFVSGLVDKFLELTENRRGMEDFFETGEKHLEAWVRLGVAIIRFFVALAGAGGARSGLTTIEDATKAIDDLTKKIQDNAGNVGKFFEQSRGVLYEVIGVVKALAIELFNVWTPDRVHNFAILLKRVIIPALGDIIDLLGDMTQKLVDFAETPVGEKLLKGFVAFIILNRVVGGLIGSFKLLGGASKIVGELFVDLAKFFGVFEKLAPLAATFASSLGEIALVLAPWAAVIGLIVLLLAKLGLLDDAWREIKSAFKAFWDEVQPAVKRLIDSFSDLWDAIKEGKGLFGVLLDVLRPIVRIIIQFGGIVARVFGRTLGRILSGVIDMISGFIDIITGLLTGDWSKAWEGAKRILRGAFRAITAVVRAIPELIWEIIKRIPGLFRKLGPLLLEAIKWAFNKLWDFLERLPGRLETLGEKAAKAFVKAFKDVGSDIIKGILGGLTHLGGFAKDIANAFIDLLNELLPNKIAVPGAPDINLPDDPIPRLETGGPAIGKGRDGFLAILHPDEHVWTASEVRAAGGHQAMFAMRRQYGGGGQGSGGRYQEGGRAAAAAGALTVTFVGGGMDDFMSRWRAFWNLLVAIARRGSNMIEFYFRDMRVKTAQTMHRMERDINQSLDDIVDSFKGHGKRIVRSWTDTFKDLMDVTHSGLFYIGHETNQALGALSANKIDFNLTAPQAERRAVGGFLGQPGERGRDAVHALLGRGEAVLNWAHQKVVNSALWNQYGMTLPDMFRRMNSFHAGGAEQPGYASGGYTGPGHSGAGFTPVWNMAKSKFGMTYFTGFDGHNQMTSSGNTSDHWYHRALDMGNGILTAGEDALNNFFKQKAPQVVKQLIWRSVDQFRGFDIGDHTDHVHLALLDQYAFNGPLMAKIISRAMRGLSISDLLRGGTDETGVPTVDHVDRLKVKGPDSAMHIILQKIFDKVRNTANKFIDDQAGTLPPGTPGQEVIISHYDGPLNHLFPKHSAGASGFVQLSPKQVTDIAESVGLPGRTFEQIAHGESNYFPGVVSWDGGWGLWQNTPRVWGETALAYLRKLGGIAQLLNPIKNAMMAKFLYQAAGNSISPWYGTKYVTSARGGFPGIPQFAEGGIVPGGDGTPIGVIAHAGEWILNKFQQSRLAGMLGMGPAGLRSVLGFHGGPTSFQGGGAPSATKKEESTADFPFTTEGMRKRLRQIAQGLYELPAFAVETWEGLLKEARRVFQAMRAKHANSERRLKAFDALTKENGILDLMDQARERFTNALTRQLTFAAYHFNRATRRVTQRARMDTDIETTTRELTNARKEMGEILGEEGVINKALKRVNARLSRLRRGGIAEGEVEELQKLEATQRNLQERRRGIRDAHAQQLEKIFQAQVARQQAYVDEISARFEKESGGRELFQRIAQALGDEGTIAKLNAAQRDMLTRQANELEGRINAARRAGAGELADQLSAQVADLRVQIFESIQQELRDAMDRINARAQRRTGRLDLAGRMLDAVGAVGLSSVAGLAGEQFTRGGLFAQRGAVLTQQRADLQGVLRGAQAQGNLALIDELTDALAELDVTIKENTKAYFDARVEDVNNRAGFSLNVNDLMKQITELEGTISGNTDQAKLTALLQERGNVLADQRAQLEALLLEAQQTGNQQAVNDLTVALLENRVAILQNTQAVNEATGAMTQPQTFTSSAWTRFREAIFNGMGQVLPQYNPQNMMGEINTGAVIIPGAGGGVSRVSGDTNINLYEVGRPVDLQEVSAAVAFASKTSQ